MNTKFLKKAFIISMLGVSSAQVYAANTDAALVSDNGAAATSTGNFDVNITKGDAVAITGLASSGGVTINGSNGLSDQTGSIDVCTFATTATYQLEINSTETGTAAFDATDGTNLMPFSVEWADGTNTWTFSGNGDAAQTGATTTVSTDDPTCAGGTNTTITVTVASADFNAQPAGTYTDTLAVIIAAQ